MSKIRVGVIGCGSIAIKRHIPEYAENENVEFVAFCDPILSRAEEQASIHNAKAYANYEDMLNQEQLDAVSVCTPNYLHAPAAIASMNKGFHVLVEKPMAVTKQEALDMIKASEDNQVHLMVGHNQRFMPPHVKAKEILSEGKLGKVLSFRTAFGHPGPEGWSIDGRESWFFRKEEAIMGAMGDLGVHKSDLIRWLLEDEVDEISAIIGTLDKKQTEVDDHASCVLKMKSGAIGTLTASWVYYKAGDNSTVLWCEHGALKIGTDGEDQVIVEMRDGSVEHFKVGAMATNEKQVTSHVIDAFIDSIINKTVPAVTGEEGMRSLSVILAAFESNDKGTSVKL